ncbi:hypothetical protein PAXINDRAFT_19237 [Paxillus involutus ATCC 200175]|uniref:Uncharacterized protein n=1 Tax=Paxillus involutus ATCC 200175 TaxID=664439 RepID=A0A0C9SX85_PAXIN|nr:hypothetical protein PAXINDRAFT_19237 [Paxillus involutus ATCC 200175]
MSSTVPSTPFPRPNFAVLCQICQMIMEWRLCTNNENGNEGRWYAACKTRNSKGQPEGFKWGSPRASPNLSPTLSTGSLQPAEGSTSGGQHHDDHDNDHEHRCAIPGCKNTRVAANCDNFCCRKHCLALGGCKSKKHKLSAVERKHMAVIDPTLLAAPTPMMENHSYPLTPSDTGPSMDLDVAPCSQDLGLATPSSRLSVIPALDALHVKKAMRQPSSSTPKIRNVAKGKGKAKARSDDDIDMLASSRHPSQLPAVFTAGYAQKELLRQQKESRDSEQHTLNQRAAATIHVFGWPRDGEESQEFEVQDMSTNPLSPDNSANQLKLAISAIVLQGLGMGVGVDGQSMLQYFNPSRSRWINILQGHVLALSTPHAYLCSLGVTSMPDFDIVFTTCTTAAVAVPNIRSHLTAERASVRSANHRDLLQMAAPSSHAVHSSIKKLPSVIEITSSSEDNDNSDAVTARKSQGVSCQANPPLSHRTHASTNKFSHPVHRSFGSQHIVKPERFLGTIDLTSSDESSTDLHKSIFDPTASGSTMAPIDVDAIAPSTTPAWPKGFYTCEVALVFEAVAGSTHGTTKKIFQDLYGAHVCFCPSTFSEHLKRWKGASPSSRARFLEAGKTEEGRYINFMKENPAPGVEVKAAKKRLRRNGEL